MSAIMVNSTQLRQKATQLEQYNKQFKQRVDALSEKERSLGTMWEGEAKKAFHNEFTHSLRCTHNICWVYCFIC